MTEDRGGSYVKGKWEWVESGKKYPTSHPQSVSIEGSDIEEGGKEGIKLSSIGGKCVKVPGCTETVER